MPTHAARADAQPSDGGAWIERARRMTGYYDEAMDFIRRAAHSHPAIADDVYALVRLWADADQLDELTLPLLERINAELLGGAGALDTTRGVSGYCADGERRIFYECGWALEWDDSCAVSVSIGVDDEGVFHAYAGGARSQVKRWLGYPPTESVLQDALADVYVREATAATVIPAT